MSIDLTQRPPRSARVKLGGYVLLPRVLDKGRAQIAGKPGEYKYACPLDQQFLTFAGIDPAQLLEQLKAGKGDGEILEWVSANAKNKRSTPEIMAWSCQQEQRSPADVETREFFQSLHKGCAPHRNDIQTWFELLDVDDFASFGGKA